MVWHILLPHFDETGIISHQIMEIPQFLHVFGSFRSILQSMFWSLPVGVLNCICCYCTLDLRNNILEIQKVEECTEKFRIIKWKRSSSFSHYWFWILFRLVSGHFRLDLWGRMLRCTLLVLWPILWYTFFHTEPPNIVLDGIVFTYP